MTPVPLSYLTLHPIPVDLLPFSSHTVTVPADSTAALEDLLAEAESLYASPDWKHEKAWSDGQVVTATLGIGGSQPRLKDGLHHPTPTANGDASAAHATKVEKPKGGSRFWNRSHESSAGATADKHDSIAWHRRATILSSTSVINYDTLWATLGVSGAEHLRFEAQYSGGLKVVEVEEELGKGSYLKLHNLPFPTTDRSFLSWVGVVICDASKAASASSTTLSPTPLSTIPSISSSATDTRSHDPTSTAALPKTASSTISKPLRQFQIFSLPISTPSKHPSEKSHVRGSYVAVERVRELESGEIEWCCISMSDPGGSIPSVLSEGHMASSMSAHVPLYLKWLKDKWLPANPQLSSSSRDPHHSTHDSSKPEKPHAHKRMSSLTKRFSLLGGGESGNEGVEVTTA